MGKIARSWQLVKQSWQVIKRDKSVLMFPVLSTIVTLALTASFWIPVGVTLGITSGDAATKIEGSSQIVMYLLLFVFYVLSYFVVMFFNAGLITCAQKSLRGEDSTVREGMRGAAAHLPQIILWAIVSATIGIILQIIADKFKLVGQIIVAILGTAWSLVTYFVLPILILENEGVLEAGKKSGTLFKKTWGENIVGNISIGFIFFLIGLLGVIPIVLSLFSGSVVVIFATIIVVLGFWLLLGVISSALGTIFQVALLQYAETGKVVSAFREEEMKNAFLPKK